MLKKVLLVYLLLALLVGVVWIGVVVSQSMASTSAIRKQEQALDSQRLNYDAAHDEALQLREKQRQERDNYSGQEAIAASAAAQAAIAEEQTFLEQVNAAEAAIQAAKEALARKQKSLVPLIALTLLHALALPLVLGKKA